MSNNNTKLIEYCFGVVDRYARNEVQQELDSSAHARDEMAAIEQVLDQLVEVHVPLRPSAELRQRLLASLDPGTPFEGFVERLSALFDLEEERIRELLDTIRNVPQKPWVRSGIPGTSMLHFEGGSRLKGADCGLVHVAPGQVFPAHRHLGEEWALVLQGHSEFDNGRLVAPGDLVYSPPDSEHTFRILDKHPCIFAVVLHGGIEIVHRSTHG